MSRLFRRAAVASSASVALVALMAGPALAHVTVNSAGAEQGGYASVNVKVPTESDTASTVGVKLQLPADHPFSSVTVKPHPGWTYTVTSATLDTPIESHGEEITEAVSVIEWTADAGGGIKPGEYDEFSISVGPLPEVDSIIFKAIQTYSDGSEVSWTEEAAEGADEPEHPAPSLALAPAADGDHGHGAGADLDTASAESDTTSSDSSTTTVALILGAAGLAAGLGGLWLGLSARRTAKTN